MYCNLGGVCPSAYGTYWHTAVHSWMARAFATAVIVMASAGSAAADDIVVTKAAPI